MNDKKYYTVGTVPKSNQIILQIEDKLIHLTHKYMTAHFPDLVEALQ